MLSWPSGSVQIVARAGQGDLQSAMTNDLVKNGFQRGLGGRRLFLACDKIFVRPSQFLS